MDADVIVAGGGPVGLMLALCLAERGRDVALLEAVRESPRRSMAIGITPPSLDLLGELGLDDAFIEAGTPIRAVDVFERGRAVGRLVFEAVADRFPFILSLPQYETLRLLRARAAACARIRILAGVAAARVDSTPDRVRVIARDAEAGTEFPLSAAYAVACDGARGALAGRLGIAKRAAVYAPGFAMGDFIDRTGLEGAARLYFGPERPVESFPLPGGRRRWIVRSGWRGRADLAEPLPAAVARLTGHVLSASDQIDESWFQPRRVLARVFHRGRVALCGDAAHEMSPIGGQGMNTGFADAAWLAHALDEALAGRGSFDVWMRRYRAARVRAFRIAARRAALGMAVGVLRGRWGSAARGFAIGRLLSHPAAHAYLARWFMMRSLPPAAVADRTFAIAEKGRRHAFG